MNQFNLIIVFINLNLFNLVLTYIISDSTYNKFIYDDLKVETDAGTVQGDYKTSSIYQPIRQFIGIPYAQKPIDYYRFTKPVPYVRDSSYASTIINTRQEVKCIQTRDFRSEYISKLLDKIPESEDCLYLNVYTPRQIISTGTKYPVIVYIHGGEFKYGSKSIQSPELLVNKNIVFVTINYRLGLFGFLSYENEYLPGNYGIHDVLLALKWVQREISRFNGDPNLVTLFGHDSGAIIANLLLMANLDQFNSIPTSNLFHRIILSGGTIYTPYALDYFPRYQSELFAMEVGCGELQFNNRDFVQCLRECTVEQLLNGIGGIKHNLQEQNYIGRIIPEIYFRPVIDSNLTYPLFKRDPLQMFENGEYQTKIPLIVLLTEFEGSHYFYQVENELPLETSKNNLNKVLTDISSVNINRNYLNNQINYTSIITTLIQPYLRPDSNFAALSTAIFHHYFTEYIEKSNGRHLSFNQIAFEIITNMLGDFLQYSPAHRLLIKHSLTSSIAKLYIFNTNNYYVQKKCNLWPNVKYFRCPTHGEEIFYLLHNTQLEQQKQANHLSSLIRDFASAYNIEYDNYFALNRAEFHYVRINQNKQINFRSLITMNFWSNYIVNLQKETLHEHFFFPIRQYEDFRLATWTLTGLSLFLIIILILICLFLNKRRIEEKQSIKLLKIRDKELNERYKNELSDSDEVEAF